MKLRDSNTNLPVHDYSNALRSAVDWLGDRYLLAAPVAPRHNGRRLPWLFLESDPSRWIDKPRS